MLRPKSPFLERSSESVHISTTAAFHAAKISESFGDVVLYSGAKRTSRLTHQAVLDCGMFICIVHVLRTADRRTKNDPPVRMCTTTSFLCRYHLPF